MSAGQPWGTSNEDRSGGSSHRPEVRRRLLPTICPACWSWANISPTESGLGLGTQSIRLRRTPQTLACISRSVVGAPRALRGAAWAMLNVWYTRSWQTDHGWATGGMWLASEKWAASPPLTTSNREDQRESQARSSEVERGMSSHGGPLGRPALCAEDPRSLAISSQTMASCARSGLVSLPRLPQAGTWRKIARRRGKTPHRQGRKGSKQGPSNTAPRIAPAIRGALIDPCWAFVFTGR